MFYYHWPLGNRVKNSDVGPATLLVALIGSLPKLAEPFWGALNPICTML